MTKTILLTAGLSLAAVAPAAAAPAPGHGGGNLTAAATPPTVTFGAATVVAGKLSGNNNGGQTATLTEDPFPYGDGYINPLTVATDANRNYLVKARGEQAATGVRVRMRVGLALSDLTPARAQRVRFSGSVAPKHDGRLVLIQRLSATGAWSTVRRTALRAATGNRSVYSTTIALRASGSYRARVLSHGDHLTGTSRTRVERVH
jgi:hypothetical protein